MTTRSDLRRRLYYAVAGIQPIPPEHRAEVPPVIVASRHSDHRKFVVVGRGRLLIEAKHPNGVYLYAIVGDNPKIGWPGDHPTAYGSAFPSVDDGELVTIGDLDNGPWWGLLEELCEQWQQAAAAHSERVERERQERRTRMRAEHRQKLDSVAAEIGGLA